MLELRRINILEFGCHHKSPNTNQLKFASRNFIENQITIKDIYGQKYCSWFEFKFYCDVHEPVYENASHFMVDMWLVLKWVDYYLVLLSLWWIVIRDLIHINVQMVSLFSWQKWLHRFLWVKRFCNLDLLIGILIFLWWKFSTINSLLNK